MHQYKAVPKFNNLVNLPQGLKAVLWDMDGTIMETECLHALATHKILKDKNPELALSYDEIEKVCIGEIDKTIYETFQCRGLLDDYSLEDFISTKNDIITNELPLLNPDSIFNPQIEKLMSEFKEMGIKQAVVTSSEKAITHTLLKYLSLTDYFSIILTREDTSENKPSAMPYLKAMEILSLTPNETLIFEDSPTGLTAAKESKAITFQACWY
jgi:beta-phosphoglucomutase-like phosphatase (HAD superfamily)